MEPASAEGRVALQDPDPGTRWRHRNGNIYTVLCIANEPDAARYPRTIVYRGENGKVWARLASDWHRSMTLIEET